MGHKVSPLAFRIPYIKTWNAIWFADKKSYAANLGVDNKIRKVLKEQLTGIPVWDIVISRNQDKLLVSIYTAKASLILWDNNSNLTKIEQLIVKAAGSKVEISVKEIKKPDLNAKIVGFQIVNQVEKRMPYKRAIKQAIAKVMEKWAKWVKVKVWGRLNWAEIARKETYKEWAIPNQTIRSDIDYTAVRAETVYGTIGIKIWIYKWEVFTKNK